MANDSDGGIFGDDSLDSHDEGLPEFPIQQMTHEASPKKGKRTTVCIADDSGNPLVAKAEYDAAGKLNLLEGYRRPTQSEWKKLQNKGQIVRQGMGEATAQVTDVVDVNPGIPKFVKIGAAVLGLGALVGGGILIFKKSRKSNPDDSIDEEIDDSDDDDEDDGDD